MKKAHSRTLSIKIGKINFIYENKIPFMIDTKIERESAYTVK